MGATTSVPRHSSSLERSAELGIVARLLWESRAASGRYHTGWGFRVLQFVIISCRIIPLICLICFSCMLYYREDYARVMLGAGLQRLEPQAYAYAFAFVFCTAEVLFFPFYVWKFSQFTKRRQDLMPYAKNSADRVRFFNHCFDSLVASVVPPPPPTASSDASKSTKNKSNSGSSSSPKHSAKKAGTNGKEREGEVEVEVGSPSNAGQSFLREILERWFFGTPFELIKRDNYSEWLSWAFFYKELHELARDERADVDSMVDCTEQRLEYRFPPGKNSDAISARLNLDPVFATQRPFFFYFTIFLLNQLVHLGLRLWGFGKLVKHSSSSQNVYFRAAVHPGEEGVHVSPQASRGAGGKGSRSRSRSRSSARRSPSPSRGLGARRVHSGAKKSSDDSENLPVVFIHGLGVGFAAYMRLISHLPRDVDVFLLEWPHVSMHMAEEVPSIQETKDLIASVLAAHGHTRACFVGHSLGTTCIAWLLRDPATAHLVGSSVIIDPVTFLLLHPKVATSFVYHNPVTPVEFALHFFVARELYISHAISRHFNWAYNIMFAEDLLMVDGVGGVGGKGKGSDKAKGKVDAERQIRHTILLSSQDSLVPVEAVVSYLRNKEEEFRRDGTDCFETTVFDGQHHGEMMLYPSMMRFIEGRIRHRMRVPLPST